ncbi:transcriptional regulator [Marisediminicola sp. LYQ134]|uniref:transcriptional regulator n=1 Tax=Marisediminicola sp. LYQ134 TaxID=3391061 RepID=UPI003983523E
MAEARFDEVIHAPMRLRVCGLLRRVDGMDFAVLRDTLEVSDATLSKHLKTLTEAGYVALKKSASTARSDARRMTWVSLTGVGRSVFDAHIRALREIAGAAD